MYVIGITGPTGAGKTTALRVLESLGGQVIDCDAVYHGLLETDGELLGRIEAAFPGVVQAYTLDRKALGTRVYADPAGLERLTEITWSFVIREVQRRLKEAETVYSRHSERSEESATASPVACCLLPVASGGRPLAAPTAFSVIDAIGLFESGLAELCDLTAAVVAVEEVRVRRLMARDGITEEYARARIAAQKPSEWFAGKADLVLENNGTADEFAEKCREEFSKHLADPLSDNGRCGQRPLRKEDFGTEEI